MIVRKKKFSFYTGLFTFCMAITWVALVSLGFVLENIRKEIRELNNQRVVLSLEQQDDGVVMFEQARHISVLIDDHDETLSVGRFYHLLPENVVFGLSPYNENLTQNVNFLNRAKRPFLIKLPLRNTEENSRSMDIALNKKETIASRVDSINFVGTYGFYHLGNDELLLEMPGIELVVDRAKQARVKMFYGVDNKTLLLQAADGNAKTVGAFDFLLDAPTKEEFNIQIKSFENVLLSKPYALVVLRINENTVEIFNSWYNSARNKGVKIIPLS